LAEKASLWISPMYDLRIETSAKVEKNAWYGIVARVTLSKEICNKQIHIT
jgi:hypothetical protein